MDNIIVINDEPAIVLEADEEDFRYKIFYKGNVETLYKIENNFHFFGRILYSEDIVKFDVIQTIIESKKLELLLEDKNYYCKYFALTNINMPKEILIKYAKSKDISLREQVAKNIKTPEEILMELINDESQNVKWSALNTLSLIDKQNRK